MAEDVKEEVVETPAEEPSPEAEEKTVPYDRFKEVVDEKNELKESLGSIGSDIKDLKKQESQTGLTDTQQQELQAKEYIKNLLNETLEERDVTENAKKEEENRTFTTEVSSALELNPLIKKDEFLAFVKEKADSYGVQSVQGAMQLFKDLKKATTEGADEAAKDIASKPSLPSHEGGSQVKGVPEGDTDKSIFQIAEEGKSSL